MRKYEFSLSKLMDVRRAEAEARQRELGEAVQARAVQERKLDGLLADEARARQVKRAVLERAQIVDELLHAQRYLEAAARRVEDGRAELAKRDETVAARRAAVMAAVQSVRVLERLDEARREEWERGARAEERAV